MDRTLSSGSRWRALLAIVWGTLGVGAVTIGSGALAQPAGRVAQPASGVAHGAGRVAPRGGGGSPRTRAASARTVPSRSDTVVTIGRRELGRPVPSGFVGLSLEYPFVSTYAGADPRAVNPVLVKLIQNLESGQAPVLRIGGDSTDGTWLPVRGLVAPRGVSYNLSPSSLALLRALAVATRARLILGINLKSGSSKVSVAEARGLLAGVGRSRIEAFEIGNEPEYYAARRDPVSIGVVPTRPPGYDFQAYSREFSRLRRLLPPIALAGPATGSLSWLTHLPQFLAAQRTLAQVTFHRYPLSRCVTDPRSPHYPTVANLLSPFASRGLMDGAGRYVAIAHRHRIVLRVDELNSVTCQGKPGVSDTFASALWVLDALFEMARVGVDAVNIHIWPRAEPNQLFTFRQLHGRWVGSVRPEYYGLLMFTQAAPPGSRLLQVRATGTGQIRQWATLALDGRVRLVLINDSLTHARSVRVQPPARSGYGMLERLQAPSAYTTGSVTFAGRSFGTQSSTGTLAGPVRSILAPALSGYEVRLPAASAALVIIAPAHRARVLPHGCTFVSGLERRVEFADAVEDPFRRVELMLSRRLGNPLELHRIAVGDGDAGKAAAAPLPHCL